MLQIKTIIDNSASKFDKEVNKALADGWTLTRRLAGPKPSLVCYLGRAVHDLQRL